MGCGVLNQHKWPGIVVWQSFTLLSYPSLLAHWLEHLHGKPKVLGSIPGLGKPFSPKYDCSLHKEWSLKRLWMIGEETSKHAWILVRHVVIYASLLSLALKISSFGWKTSLCPFPQMGQWNAVLFWDHKQINSKFRTHWLVPINSRSTYLYSCLCVP